MNALQVKLTFMQFKPLPMSPYMCYLCIKSIHFFKEGSMILYLFSRNYFGHYHFAEQLRFLLIKAGGFTKGLPTARPLPLR